MRLLRVFVRSRIRINDSVFFCYGLGNYSCVQYGNSAVVERRSKVFEFCVRVPADKRVIIFAFKRDIQVNIRKRSVLFRTLNFVIKLRACKIDNYVDIGGGIHFFVLGDSDFYEIALAVGFDGRGCIYLVNIFSELCLYAFCNSVCKIACFGIVGEVNSVIDNSA